MLKLPLHLHIAALPVVVSVLVIEHGIHGGDTAFGVDCRAEAVIMLPLLKAARC